MIKRRDARMLCRCCKRWMRSGKPTKLTPATRRPAPHASVCTDCPPEHVSCSQSACSVGPLEWEERQAIRREHAPQCPGRAKRPSNSLGLPDCDTEEAEDLDPATGMFHTKLNVIERGTYTDVAECERCKRQIRVAAGR